MLPTELFLNGLYIQHRTPEGQEAFILVSYDPVGLAFGFAAKGDQSCLTVLDVVCDCVLKSHALQFVNCHLSHNTIAERRPLRTLDLKPLDPAKMHIHDSALDGINRSAAHGRISAPLRINTEGLTPGTCL